MSFLFCIYDLDEGARGYLVAGNVERPATTPNFSEGRIDGTPGAGFWSREPDSLKSVDFTIRANPVGEDGSDIYWMTMIGGVRRVIDETPGLREALQAALEA